MSELSYKCVCYPTPCDPDKTRLPVSFLSVQHIYRQVQIKKPWTLNFHTTWTWGRLRTRITGQHVWVSVGQRKVRTAWLTENFKGSLYKYRFFWNSTRKKKEFTRIHIPKKSLLHEYSMLETADNEVVPLPGPVWRRKLIPLRQKKKKKKTWSTPCSKKQ